MKKLRIELKRETDELLELVESFLLSFFIVFLLFTYFFQISTVDGNSMQDTLQDDERIVSMSFFKATQGSAVVIESEYAYVLDRELAVEASYRELALKMKHGEIERVSEEQLRELAAENVEKIIVDGTRLYRALGLNKRIVKRIIATEGQRVKIDFTNGDVFVDGELIDEPYIKNLTLEDHEAFDYPVIIPKGYVFVLADNRYVSKDSRHPDIGLVPVDHIVGKCFLRVFPLTEISIIH